MVCLFSLLFTLRYVHICLNILILPTYTNIRSGIMGDKNPPQTTESSKSDNDTSTAERQLSADEEAAQTASAAPMGKPWMYKPINLGLFKMPWYASPEMQLYLVSFVCFLCPGMYNAVTGLGGGGQVDMHDVSDSNTALYSTFAVVGFFAGSIANRIGLKLTLSIGGFGYFLYVAALLCYNYTKNSGFLIFSGALLGVCGGLLWCGQGAIMMSYPKETEKGKYISIFWVIFNLGGVIGSLVSNNEIQLKR